MANGLRVAILFVYLLVAVALPVWIANDPGEPPMMVDTSLLEVVEEKFVAPQGIMGEGADNFEQGVMNDLDGHMASVAADYPDGSNVVLIRFEEPFYARRAAAHLIDLIPHRDASKDLWSVGFISQSGEYVLVAHSGRVAVMIIADRKELAEQRFKTLPLFSFNEEPGLGAVLAQQPVYVPFFAFLGYLIFQLMTLIRLTSWSATRRAAFGAERLSVDEFKPVLASMSEAAPLRWQFLLRNEQVLYWQLDEVWANSQAGATSISRLRVRVEARKHRLSVLHETAQVDVTGPLDEDALAKLEWKATRRVPLKVFQCQPQVHIEQRKVSLLPLKTVDYSDDQLWALLATLSTNAGWKCRPVISFSTFVNG